MTIAQNPLSFGRAIQKRQSDDFARLRSIYVDKFSAVELPLNKLCIKYGIANIDNCSTGKKIRELSLLKPSSNLPKAISKQISEICVELFNQISIRNAISHATMVVGTRGNEDVAFFQKSSDAAKENPIYFVMGFDDFYRATEAIKILTLRLYETLNPPPSQRPPLQGATGGL